nr:DUF2771 family protein [Corynebacterium lactis]
MGSKQRRLKQKGRAMMVVGIIVIVGLAVTGIVLAVTKWSNKAIEDPRALTIEVTQGETTTKVHPYRICDLFEKDSCTTIEANSQHISLAPEETAEVKVGTAIGSNAWAVQRFFADDSVNSSTKKNPGEATGETIAGSAAVNGERTPLGVVEVSTALVGKNAAGEETTYGITWSIVNDHS